MFWRHGDAKILIGELGSGERGRCSGYTRINETNRREESLW